MKKPLSKEQRYDLEQIIDSADVDATYDLIRQLREASARFPKGCFLRIMNNLRKACDELEELLED